MRLKRALSLGGQNVWLFTFQNSAICKEIHTSTFSNIVFFEQLQFH